MIERGIERGIGAGAGSRIGIKIDIKICGLNREDAVDTAVREGADWLGFVFFARSPRAVTPAQAAVLAARHPGAAPAVGLFVRPTEAEVAACLDRVPLAALQLYGAPEQVQALQARFGLPVWHACAVAERADLPRETSADRLLIESRPPADADRPGGNGVALDWGLLRGWAAPAPWMLAGGLTADNVGEAVRASGAPAVDVSSGVECQPGVKDPARIAAFIRAARDAHRASLGASGRVG